MLHGEPLPVIASGELGRPSKCYWHQQDERAALRRTIPAPPVIGHRRELIDGERRSYSLVTVAAAVQHERERGKGTGRFRGSPGARSG